MSESEAWVMIPKLDEKGTGCVLDMHPLVLCKDCKFQVDRGRRYPECDKHFLLAEDNWFCADGEKRPVKRE